MSMDLSSGGTLLVRGGTVVASWGTAVADVRIENGQITAIGRALEAGGDQVIDADGLLVLPGGIDPHVQFYDPVEDYGASESAFAVQGGVTTICKMHRSLEDYAPSLAAYEDAFASVAHCDFQLNVALMTPEHVEQIPTYARMGVRTFKVFTAYKDQWGTRINVRGLDDGLLLEALRSVAAIPGGRVMVHAEGQELLDAAGARERERHPETTDPDTWNRARPDYSEAEAIRRVCFLAKLSGCPVYIVHTTSALGVEQIAAAQRDGVDVVGETGMHYLLYAANDPDWTPDIRLTVIPPIRRAVDRARLWDGVLDGTLTTLGSDHVPALAATKDGRPVWDAGLGFPGTGVALPLLLSEGVRRGRLDLDAVIRLTALGPARALGLPRKGDVAIGMDGDLALVDRDLTRTIRGAELATASDFALGEGREVTGWPVATVVRGTLVMQDGRLTTEGGVGRNVRAPLPEPAASSLTQDRQE